MFALITSSQEFITGVLKRFKNFVSTVFIGGLLAILPIIIVYKVFTWLFQWLQEFMQPFTNLIAYYTGQTLFVAEMMAMSAVVIGCFIVGIIVKTAWGRWLHSFTENVFLSRIPGYSAIKELLNQFQPDNKDKFSRPVLITLDHGENYFMGFVTDSYDDGHYAVFIPTSPSPVNGFVVQTTAECLRFVDVASETMMRSVVSCGVGSSRFAARPPSVTP